MSYPPYLFEAALYGEVVEDECKATVSTSEVKFHLKKKDATMLWGQLYVDGQFEDKVRFKL